MLGLQRLFFQNAQIGEWFLYLDDEIDPKDVDEHESASFGEESPRSKDGMECGCEGVQGAGHQSVKDTAKLCRTRKNMKRKIYRRS